MDSKSSVKRIGHQTDVFKDYIVICDCKYEEKIWRFEGYHKQSSYLDKEIFSSLSINPDDYHIYCPKEQLTVTASFLETECLEVCAIDGEYIHGMFLNRPESPNWLYLKSDNGIIHHFRKDFIVMIASGYFFLFKKDRMIRVEESA